MQNTEVILDKILLNYVRNDDIKKIEEAIQDGFEIDFIFKEYKNFTLLSYSICIKRYNICEFLIKNGANVNKKILMHDIAASAPLYYAINHRSYDICKLLIENGARVNDADYYNKSPLYFAIQYGTYNICKLLIEKGANVCEKNIYTETLLHTASKNDRSDICELLIDNGIDVLQRDHMGNHAYYYCYNNKELRNYLYQKVSERKILNTRFKRAQLENEEIENEEIENEEIEIEVDV